MDFLEALKNKKNSGRIPVIPDIKVYSPKEGELLFGRDPVDYAKQLVAAGAPVLSVVTEEKEFHGSLKLLQDVCFNVQVPVLRKDFIETAEELDETVKAGASAILLMAACLGEEKLTVLYQEALNKGLMPLVETHTSEELEFARKLGAPLIGINNRNILELERDDGDVQLAKALLGQRETFKADSSGQENEPFIIVESALKNAEDVRIAVRSGADAALVGTALLRSETPAALYRAMSRHAELKICGVMNQNDADLCVRSQVDLIGFVTEYPVDVPWNLDRTAAKKLIGSIRGQTKTCIVTGGSRKKILDLAREVRPDLVQLHYTETLEETGIIAGELHDLGIRVIRSIPSDPVMRRNMFGTESVSEAIALLDQSPVDEILIDSRDAGNAASGGDSILTQISEEVCGAVRKAGKPVMAGGGITAENVREIQKALKPDCIDVMTGSEDRPGKKSQEKISALLKELM